MRDPETPVARQRNWKHIHRSPLFWLGLFLCLAAIGFYVVSEDLSWRPRLRLSHDAGSHSPVHIARNGLVFWGLSLGQADDGASHFVKKDPADA